MLASQITYDMYETSKRYFKNAENFMHLSDNKLQYRKLTETFHFVINGNYFEILPGFWWDGASIPRFLWTLIGSPWEEDIAPGALIHDVLYGSQVFKRKISDEVMYHINVLNGMGKIKANSVYSGLRMGGSGAWNNKTKEIINGVRKHLKINDKLAIKYDNFNFLYV